MNLNIIIIFIILLILFYIVYTNYEKFSVYAYNSSDIPDLSKSLLEIENEKIRNILNTEYSLNSEYDINKIDKSI